MLGLYAGGYFNRGCNSLNRRPARRPDDVSSMVGQNPECDWDRWIRAEWLSHCVETEGPHARGPISGGRAQVAQSQSSPTRLLRVPRIDRLSNPPLSARGRGAGLVLRWPGALPATIPCWLSVSWHVAGRSARSSRPGIQRRARGGKRRPGELSSPPESPDQRGSADLWRAAAAGLGSRMECLAAACSASSAAPRANSEPEIQSQASA